MLYQVAAKATDSDKMQADFVYESLSVEKSSVDNILYPGTDIATSPCSPLSGLKTKMSPAGKTFWFRSQAREN